MSVDSQIITCKLVVLGEHSVGKSSVLSRYVEGVFNPNQEPTIGAAYMTRIIRQDEKTLKFEIWDTAGLERFQNMRPQYYRGAQIAIVMYEIHYRKSYVRAKNLLKELKMQAPENIIIAFVGNKVELSSRREVEIEDAKEYANKNNAIFMETSAKTGINIEKLFSTLAEQFLDAQKDEEKNKMQPQTVKIRLKPRTTSRQPPKRGCCNFRNLLERKLFG